MVREARWLRMFRIQQRAWLLWRMRIESGLGYAGATHSHDRWARLEQLAYDERVAVGCIPPRHARAT